MALQLHILGLQYSERGFISFLRTWQSSLGLLILSIVCVCVCVHVHVQVLNEVVVDRGPSSYLSNVDLYLDGRLITSVQGDGGSVLLPEH